MDTVQILGRVIDMGQDWAEVEACGEERRVQVSPGLFVHVGSIVRIYGDRITSTVETSELSPPTDFDLYQDEVK